MSARMWTADNSEHRKLGNRRKRVGVQFQRGRANPCTFQHNILQRVFDDLAQMRGLPSTCGMIFRRKFGAASAAFTAFRSAARCL